jgi:hypothetical protein
MSGVKPDLRRHSSLRGGKILKPAVAIVPENGFAHELAGVAEAELFFYTGVV